MKIFSVGLFILLSLLSKVYSQRLLHDSIPYYKLHYIYSEITEPNKYTVAECEDFARTLANYDLKNKTKRFLVSYGMFSTGCYTCIHYKYGYSETNFGPDDIYFTNVEAFKNRYNAVMKSVLEDSELLDIEKSFPSKRVFTEYLTSLLNLDYKKENDTLINLTLSSDTLEYYFKDDINKLIVSITIDSTESKYNYKEIKTSGAKIKVRGTKEINVFIVLDFTNVPANYDICWCPALKQKYRFRQSLNLK